MTFTKTKDRHVVLRESIAANSDMLGHMNIKIISKPIDKKYMAWQMDSHDLVGSIDSFNKLLENKNFIPYIIGLSGYGHFAFMRSPHNDSEYDRTVRMVTHAINKFSDIQKSHLAFNDWDKFVKEFKQFKSWVASARIRLKQKYGRTGYVVEFLYCMFFKHGADNAQFLNSVNTTTRGFYISDSIIFFNVMNAFVSKVNNSHNTHHWFELFLSDRTRSRYVFDIDMPLHDMALNHLMNGEHVVYDDAIHGINFNSGKIVTSGNDKNSVVQSLFDLISMARDSNSVVVDEEFESNLYDPLVYRLQNGAQSVASTALAQIRKNIRTNNTNSTDDIFDRDRLRYTYLARKGVVRFSDPNIVAHIMLAYPDYINTTESFVQVPHLDNDGYLVPISSISF